MLHKYAPDLGMCRTLLITIISSFCFGQGNLGIEDDKFVMKKTSMKCKYNFKCLGY